MEVNNEQLADVLSWYRARRIRTRTLRTDISGLLRHDAGMGTGG